MNLNTKNYLRYAVGEILLVVVGILIALQVNNWNEERKLKLSEKVLLSFYNEVSNNLNSLKTSIDEKKTIIKINKEILTSPNSD